MFGLCALRNSLRHSDGELPKLMDLEIGFQGYAYESELINRYARRVIQSVLDARYDRYASLNRNAPRRTWIS